MMGIQRVTLGGLLVTLILLTSTDSSAQSSRKKAPTLPQALEQLELAKTQFESDCNQAADKVVAAFGSLAEAVDRDRSISVADRATIQKDLRMALADFERDRSLRPIPALQPAYSAYIITVRKSYYALLAKYDRVIRLLPREDERKPPLEAEVDELAQKVNRLDLLQPGRTWIGYRADFNAGPQLKAVSGNRYRLVQDRPVNVDFTFQVTERKGDSFRGIITQEEGRFRAEVEGRFDGVIIKMGMTRMLAGAPRQFEYAGKLVGSLGMLQLRGNRADRRYTEGELVLQLRE